MRVRRARHRMIADALANPRYRSPRHLRRHIATLGAVVDLLTRGLPVPDDLREAAFLADRIFCMSSRPGRIIAERQVEFARPRDLDITYTGEFTDLVHDLRSQIASARQAS